VYVTSPLIPYPMTVVMQARWLIVERVPSEGIPHCWQDRFAGPGAASQRA